MPSLFSIQTFSICVLLFFVSVSHYLTGAKLVRATRDPRRGLLGTEGRRTRVMYFAEEGVFFKTSACPRFCKRRVLLCTQVRSMGGGGGGEKSPYNPRNIRGSDAEWLPK